MIFPQPQLLLVDDSPLNLKILLEFLPHQEYQCTTANGGQQAWDMLTAEPDRFHAVLLDRIMPGVDGMEVLHKMKQHDALNQIPVIMQTAATTHQQTLEGLRAGAYYYLAKPFDQATLQAIVDAAVRDHLSYLDIRQALHRTTTTMRLLESGTFHFRTPEEAKNLAMLLAHAYPDADRVVTGILELTLNAIEHGNLNIGYREKSRLIEADQLEEEIAHRLSSPPYSSRVATAKFSRQPHGLTLHITDQGNGFDWKQYLDFDPERAFDTHGRGIAMANKVSFDQIEYRGHGNQVMTVLHLEQAAQALAV
ncbi:MAG: response regulator [Nitrospira sp. CR1.1]|jgi:DNA-binding response OmpR family regulator|nr:response regulator [Nitrospira sp. CR1.1]